MLEHLLFAGNVGFCSIALEIAQMRFPMWICVLFCLKRPPNVAFFKAVESSD